MRKQTRFLSSLVDLKLQNESARTIPFEEQGKRKAIRNQGIACTNADNKIFENFHQIDKKKSSIDKSLILKSLSSHFTLSTLISDKEMQELLLQKFRLCRVNKGQYLMKQNTQASSFFILHEGQLVVEINGIPKRKIQSGQGFGELALLYSAKRSASIKALKSSFLWFIDRSTFKKAIQSLIGKNYENTRKLIEQNDFFKQLTKIQKDQISSIGIVQKFQKGQKIIKKGELASSIYIVKEGLLSKQVCSKKNEPTKVFLQPGNIFGENTLFDKSHSWEETVTAQKNSQLIALGAKDIEQVLGKSLPLIILRNKIRQILVKNLEFKKLTQYYMDLTLDCFKIQNFTSNDRISTKAGIFVVLQGDYKIVNKATGAVWMVDSKSNKNKVLHGTIQKQLQQLHEISFLDHGKVAITTTQDILAAFGSSYQQAIQKSLSIKQTNQKYKNQLAMIKQQCAKINLKDYQYISKLGQGQFGTVFLVTNPNKSKLFALKCISKASVINNKIQKYVVNEKEILEELSESSPFCVNFIRSYKDNNFIYFLMEFIEGLELFDVIRLIGILNVEQTRFYGAILTHILQAMHTKGIIYRDLKPENVMVQKDGYLKLIDMGTCKNIGGGSNKNSLRTFTAIGTPNYMAPQIISGTGYSYSADLWSLGIVLYEFMAGYVPFGEQLDDPHQICQQILRKPLEFPNYMKDHKTNQFISQLLSKNPDSRLGGSFSNLKSHPFLKNVEWDTLLAKTMKPAFLIPPNKLPQVSKLISKAKTLESKLPVPESINPKRNFDPNWDQLF